MAYYNAKGIRKEVEAVAEYQKKLNNNTLNLQCKCRHRDERGMLSIRPDGARPDGSKIYVCTECGKKIVMKKPTEDEAKAAFDMVDAIYDQMKMTNRADKDELFVRIADAQVRNLYFRKLYLKTQENIKNGGNNFNGENRNHGYGDGGRVSWKNG